MARETDNAMEKKVTLTWLLAFYGEMLTDNQKEMARLHWEEDLTLSEIAGQFAVSRQSVHDTLSRTEKQLEGLEDKLGLLRRFRSMEQGLEACERELKQVRPADGTQAHLEAALHWIRALRDQEEE